MFAQKNNCIRRESCTLQFGFGLKVSAQDAFLYFIDTIQHEIEIGKIVNAVLYNLSKAFDSLSHQMLLKKLHSLHFSPSAMHIVESFLTGQLQKVSASGVLSERIELKQGVPQGKVEGPFFQLVCEWFARTYERICSNSTVCWRLFNHCSDKGSEIAIEVYIISYKLEEFCCYKMNLNANETEFITLFFKNDNFLNELEKVTVGSTRDFNSNFN